MKDRISDIILQGLVTDLYRTERAIFIHKEIGQYSGLINNSKSNIKKIFILLQSFCFNEAILSLSRVYDYPSLKYQNRCVLRLIEILKESGENALPISETYQTLDQIRYFRIPEMVGEYLMQRDHVEFTKYLSLHFELVLIQTPFQDKIKELKEIRDKILAHNEVVNDVKTITWTTFDELIDFVKMVVGIVGWAFLSTAYMQNGKHLLTEDAEREKYIIRNMLKELGILNEA
jgi:hypothetical protein